jgi:hypothetical protein
MEAKHILGEENRLADFLSRWQTHKKYAAIFNQSIAKNIYEEIKVEKCHFSCHFRFLNNNNFVAYIVKFLTVAGIGSR